MTKKTSKKTGVKRTSKGSGTTGERAKKTTSKRRSSAETTTSRSRPQTADIEVPKFSVGVFESATEHRTRAIKAIESAGYTPITELDLEGIQRRDASTPPIVLVGIPGGGAIIDGIGGLGPDRAIVIGSISRPAGTARRRAEAAGVDLYAMRPHSAQSLGAILYAATELHTERQRVQAVRGTEQLLRERLQRYGQADAATGFQHFDFFKQVLVMEMKRAKRYGYSLAACLVAIDPSDSPGPSEVALRTLRTRVASAISAAIRDIDLPVDVADDRMLVFLPYTDVDGATRVGKRVVAAVRSYGTIRDGDHNVSMSVSVGVSALASGKPLSFARLMKEARAAVRAAQLKGGNRVVVRSQSK